MADALALPLTTSFPCRASEGAASVRHPVVVMPDWQVVTGHDEELERIAEALGGGASCVKVLPSVLPALHRWWHRATRNDGLVVRSDDAGRSWHSVDGTLPCCPADGFADPREAGAHARSIPHVGQLAGCRRELRLLVGGIAGDTDPPAPALPDGSSPSPLLCAAWECGLRPDRAATLAEVLHQTSGAEALPVLLSLAQSGADPLWVAASAAVGVLRIRGDDPDDLRHQLLALLAWLAWTETDLDRADPAARGVWLVTGTRRTDIAMLSAAGYAVEEARALAAGWGMSVPGAAQLLARWASIGYRPRAADLLALHETLAFPPPPPAMAAVRRVIAMLSTGSSARVDPTAVALEIVRSGTAAGAFLELSGRLGRGPRANRGQGGAGRADRRGGDARSA